MRVDKLLESLFARGIDDPPRCSDISGEAGATSAATRWRQKVECGATKHAVRNEARIGLELRHRDTPSFRERGHGELQSRL